MTGNFWQLNKILWKQYLLKHRIWFVLLLFLTVILKVSQSVREETEIKGIDVGVCAYDKEGMQLFEDLHDEEKIFRFQLFEEESALCRAVENGNVECGYVLPKGFFDNMMEGKIRRQIRLYYSATSAAHKLSYEVVFSHLFDMLSEKILRNWLLESGMCDETEREEKVKQLKELGTYYKEGNMTFSFSFEKVGTEKEDREVTIDSMRGLVGVVIFFFSLLGLGNCCDLCKNILSLPKYERVRIKEQSLHIAVVGSVVTGGIFLIVMGNFGGMGKELTALVCYLVILTIYIRILGLFLKTAQAVYSAIPALLVASVLFCPVFFRAENFVPAVAYLQKLFPVFWYLNGFL